MCVKKTHKQTWKTVDESAGQYFTVERVAVELAHSASGRTALDAARRYCLRAAKMGGRWVQWGGMAEVYTFLFVQRRSIEVFERAWSLYESHQEEEVRSKKVGWF